MNQNQNQNQVTCGNCKQKFTIQTETTRLPGGSEEVFFHCPHCRQTYGIYRITRRGREIREQLSAVKAQLRMAPHAARLVAQRDTLQAQLSAEITDLTKLRLPVSSSS